MLEEINICQNGYIPTDHLTQALPLTTKQGGKGSKQTASSHASGKENCSVHVQNVLIRDLCSPEDLKLPLFIEFDKKFIKKQFLLQSIREVEQCSNGKVQIWAVVFDAQKHGEVIDELGLNEEVSHFPHPVDPYSGRNVYCFADINALIAMQQNDILENGIEIEHVSNEFVSIVQTSPSAPATKARLIKDDFEKVFQHITKMDKALHRDCDSIQILSKYEGSTDFMAKHICPTEKCEHQQIQKNRLLSREMADAMGLLFPDKQIENEWIQVWSDFYEIAVGESVKNNFSTVCGFGEPNLLQKVKVLNKMYSMTKNTRVLNQKLLQNEGQRCYLRPLPLQPYQKAIMWTIKSLKLLYNDLKDHFVSHTAHEDSYTVLSTSRLNCCKHDDEYHGTIQKYMTKNIKSNKGKERPIFPMECSFIHNGIYQNTTGVSSDSLSNLLYNHPLTSLSIKESLHEEKCRRRSICANKKKGKSKISRPPTSPPPANPREILEYKLSIEGKVHMPLGHPQIDTIQNKSKIQVVSKEPQIKIVYPDDPENSLLMLQQQQHHLYLPEQLPSATTDAATVEDQQQNLGNGTNEYEQEHLYQKYTTGSTTVVITAEPTVGNKALDEYKNEQTFMISQSQASNNQYNSESNNEAEHTATHQTYLQEDENEGVTLQSQQQQQQIGIVQQHPTTSTVVQYYISQTDEDGEQQYALQEYTIAHDQLNTE